MKTITITRSKGLCAIFRSLKIVVDCEHVGSVKQGQTITIKIPEDAKTLTGIMDWSATIPFSLEDIKDGDTIIIEPYFTWNLWRILGVNELPFHIKRK